MRDLTPFARTCLLICLLSSVPALFHAGLLKSSASVGLAILYGINVVALLVFLKTQTCNKVIRDAVKITIYISILLIVVSLYSLTLELG